MNSHETDPVGAATPFAPGCKQPERTWRGRHTARLGHPTIPPVS